MSQLVLYVYTVDDLSNIVAHNSAQRTAALADAQKIVNAQVQQFIEEQKRRTHRPRVLNLRARAERVRQNRLERVLGSAQQPARTRRVIKRNAQNPAKSLRAICLNGCAGGDEELKLTNGLTAWYGYYWLNDPYTEPSNDTPANNDNGEH